MAFINLPANLQDMFQSIYDRIMKLEAAINLKSVGPWQVDSQGFASTGSTGRVSYMRAIPSASAFGSSINVDYVYVGDTSITSSSTLTNYGETYLYGPVQMRNVWSRVVNDRPVNISRVFGSFGYEYYAGTPSSTERVKHNIQPYLVDTNAVLELEPVSYKYTPEVDEEQKTHYGFIAEDADRLGLYPLAGYDDEGLPDYFAMDKLPIFLLEVIKKQEKRITELENKLSTQ